MSTRLVGALVMGHGDDFGLRLPPRPGPVPGGRPVGQGRDRGGAEAADALTAELRLAGHRVRLDDRTETSFGRRSVGWRPQGWCPVRVEIGPRDVREGEATVPVTGGIARARSPCLSPR